MGNPFAPVNNDQGVLILGVNIYGKTGAVANVEFERTIILWSLNYTKSVSAGIT